MTPSSAVCTTPVCESTINKAARLIQTNRYGSVPSPTGLHRDLVRLYPETDKVRIVTTNFDLLFDAAARDLFTKKPDLFKSPALPLGREFYGIVHVHGCPDRPQGMVLSIGAMKSPKSHDGRGLRPCLPDRRMGQPLSRRAVCFGRI